MKRWEVRTKPAGISLEPIYGVPGLAHDVMAARGITDSDSVKSFLDGVELTSPFLLPDMDKAVKTINEAIDNGETICIYGDYDCDGVTSTAIMYDYFSNMGVDTICYIPERSEGYGLNMKAVDEIYQNGASLIITVDNGITAVNEALYIHELGMKLVVTDHHRPSDELPMAEAVVDPYLLDEGDIFRDFAGVGVALKLLAALEDGSMDFVMDRYSDICAIGTVADIVPLVSENRTIVKRGLEALKETDREGLLRLMEQSGVNIDALDSTAIAFLLAPRINAAGRFGSPITALDMLVSEGMEARDNADTLCFLNTKRKQTEAEIFAEIEKHISENESEIYKRVLVLSGKGWHHGVIGIVAARLTEKYGRPVVLISIDDDGMGVGSARSISGFNIFECFHRCKDLLVKYGGHECAGGLTVKSENISKLDEMIQEYATENFPSMPKFTITADKLLRGVDITEENIAGLKLLEPYGAGNPEPIFALSGARVLSVVPLKQGEHTKLEIQYDGVRLSCLMFKRRTNEVGIKSGDSVDLMGTLSVNEFCGRKSFNLKVGDFRLHGLRQDKYLSTYDKYESFKRGEWTPPSIPDADVISTAKPTREELVFTYKYLKSCVNPVSLEELCVRTGLDSFKMSITVDAFKETGLASVNNGLVSAKNPDRRVNISESPTLKRLDELIEILKKQSDNVKCEVSGKWAKIQ